MRKIILIASLLLLIGFNPDARENSVSIGEKFVPLNVRLTNSDTPEEYFNVTENTIGSFLKKWSIEGASVAIAKDGKLIFARGFGYADSASMTSAQPFNQFRVASISKLVTATAIMKLHEEGKLSLDARVFGENGVLNDPYFSNPKDPRVYDITVAQLLSHQSGWSQRYGDQMFMPFVVAKDLGIKTPVGTRDIVRFALNKKLQYTPGKGQAYSNLGYGILGLIVEKVSGMPYEDYCRKTLFEPLGIYDMAIAANLSSEKKPFEVTYYEHGSLLLKPSIYDTTKLVHPSNGGNDIRSLGGAGAWIATAPDLMKLILAVDGFSTRPDILNSESIRFMTDRNNGYAPVGWKATIDDGTWLRTGSFPGTAGMIRRQPDGISWIVLCNTSSWVGPSIYSYIDRMMQRAVSQITEWPEYDLFAHSIPVPLNAKIDEYLNRQ